MKPVQLSIGSWAYCFGPYQSNPVPFDTVIEKLGQLGFDPRPKRFLRAIVALHKATRRKNNRASRGSAFERSHGAWQPVPASR